MWKAISKETENNRRVNHGTNTNFIWSQTVQWTLPTNKQYLIYKYICNINMYTQTQVLRVLNLVYPVKASVCNRQMRSNSWKLKDGQTPTKTPNCTIHCFQTWITNWTDVVIQPDNGGLDNKNQWIELYYRRWAQHITSALENTKQQQKDAIGTSALFGHLWWPKAHNFYRLPAGFPA